MTPAQRASAETVSAALISFSGFSGFPVSTTRIVTSGIAGTMIAAGSKLQWDGLTRILIAWLVTLPVTIFIAAGLYYLFENPAASIAGNGLVTAFIPRQCQCFGSALISQPVYSEA